ncbi:MAG TPA: hypothetical protein VFR58_10145 [Flavisolibacter sp.]|nr:hypothetical protein [Flavisolibacter sp.]
MKTLNLKSTVLFLLASSLFFVSCKKDKDEPAPATIDGTWEGKYGSGNDEPTAFFGFVIKNDGTFLVSDEQGSPASGTGTWTMTGNTFKGTYSYTAFPIIKYSVEASFNAAEGKLQGSWGIGATPDDGSFVMTKK